MAAADEEDPYIWLEEVESEESLNFAIDSNAKCLKALGEPTEGPTYDRILAVLESKDRIPYAVKRGLDENGNELDFTDKIIVKAKELNEELHEKIEALVVQLYKKINVAHLDEIKALNEKLEKSNALIALLEARLNVLEAK